MKTFSRADWLRKMQERYFSTEKKGVNKKRWIAPPSSHQIKQDTIG